MEQTFIVTPVVRGGTFKMTGKNIKAVERRLAACGRKFIVEPAPDDTKSKVEYYCLTLKVRQICIVVSLF